MWLCEENELVCERAETDQQLERGCPALRGFAATLDGWKFKKRIFEAVEECKVKILFMP